MIYAYSLHFFGGGDYFLYRQHEQKCLAKILSILWNYKHD